MYALFVTVNIKEGYAEEFAAASLGDGQGSVRDEENCFRFDILRNPDNPNQFYLYEVYTDRAGHATHREQPHYTAWRSSVEHMFDGDLGRVEMETVFPRPTPAGRRRSRGWSTGKTPRRPSQIPNPSPGRRGVFCGQ